MTRFLSALAAATLGLSLSFAAPIAASAATPAQVVTITASASALFTPSQITVHAGTPVELKIVGKDGVHGVESKELGIPATMITPGSTKTITFTPTKPGSYLLHCTIMCGTHHDQMTIAVKVV